LAVKLRLTRIGKKKQPYYRIVATDSRTRRDGKYIEKIGHYNPLTNPAEITIDEEKAFYWLNNGAIPTETVKNLFSKKGIMLKWHYKKKGYDDSKIEDEYKKWEVLQIEKQKRREAIVTQNKREQEKSAEETVAEVKEESIPEEKEQVTETLTDDQDQDTQEPKTEDQTSETKDIDEQKESIDK